jgi:phage terminase large subunit-like protein
LEINYILEYWDKIQSGDIIVSKRIKQLYEKAVRELENPKPPFIFDIDLATKPITFIETFCKNSKGKWAGEPISLLLWQKAMIQVVYGFVHFETRLRRAREVFIICGRKCGKSVLTSGLGIYAMTEEGGAQVLCISTKMDAAKIVFNEALNMVKQSPWLAKNIRKRKSDLYMDAMFSLFQPLSSKINSLDGLNASFGISDEVGAIKERSLYDDIYQSQGARQQPLMFSISTAGFVREGLFDAQYKYGCDVLDGIIDNDSFLPFFYEMDEKEEIENPDLWIKANPSLRIIKSFDKLKTDVEKAKVDPTFMPTVLTKDFNIRETVSGSWLTFDDLNNTATFDIEQFRGSYCIGGVDLSQIGDLTCATIICMRRNDPVKYIHQMYFTPEDYAYQKIKSDKVPYDVWRDKGLITFCKGNKVDTSDITRWFNDTVIKKYGIIPINIGYDPAMSSNWQNEIQNYGFKITPVRQGYISVSPVMREMELDFKSKLINYNDNPILKWCLSNTQVVCDPAGNIKFDKSKNRKQRNDGMTSLYDAYKVLLDNQQDFLNMIK